MRIELYLKEVNETPVVFRWKYKLETLSAVAAHGINVAKGALSQRNAVQSRV